MNSNKIGFRLLKKEDKLLYRAIRLESLLNFPENFGITYEEATLKKTVVVANPNYRLACQILITEKLQNSTFRICYNYS